VWKDNLTIVKQWNEQWDTDQHQGFTTQPGRLVRFRTDDICSVLSINSECSRVPILTHTQRFSFQAEPFMSLSLLGVTCDPCLVLGAFSRPVNQHLPSEIGWNWTEPSTLLDFSSKFSGVYIKVRPICRYVWCCKYFLTLTQFKKPNKAPCLVQDPWFSWRKLEKMGHKRPTRDLLKLSVEQKPRSHCRWTKVGECWVPWHPPSRTQISLAMYSSFVHAIFQCVFLLVIWSIPSQLVQKTHPVLMFPIDSGYWWL